MGNFTKVVVGAVAVLALVGCSSNDSADDAKPASTSTSSTTASSTATSANTSTTATTTTTPSTKATATRSTTERATSTTTSTTTPQATTSATPSSTTPTTVDCFDPDDLDLTINDPDTYVCDEDDLDLGDGANIGHDNEVLPKTKDEWEMFCSPSSGASQKNKDDFCFTSSGGLDSIDCDALTDDPYGYCFEPKYEIPSPSVKVGDPGYCEDEALSMAEWTEHCS